MELRDPAGPYKTYLCHFSLLVCDYGDYLNLNNHCNHLFKIIVIIILVADAFPSVNAALQRFFRWFQGQELKPDVAAEAGFLYLLDNVPVVQLSCSELVPARDIRRMEMPYKAYILRDVLYYVPFRYLLVVNVIKQFHAFASGFFYNLEPFE
jgi:hypothetical protein